MQERRALWTQHGAPRRRSGAAVGLVVGLVLAAGPAALWLWDGPAGAAAPLGPPPQVAPAVLHDPVPAPVTAAALFGRADPPAATAPAPAAPVRIRAVDAGVDAPVVDTGVDERGGMAIPHDVRTVGWYRFGVGPGAAAGSAVLAGHVDDRIQGRGALYRLAELAVGSPVEVTLADGRVVAYRVGAVERLPKSVLPAGRVFARDGPPQLAVVTCGGVFDRDAGGYTENVVVTAVPERVVQDPHGAYARDPDAPRSARGDS